MRRFLLLLFFVCFISASVAEEVEDLSWLSGRWMSADTEECWSRAEGGTMLAYNRTIKDGKTTFFEFLRIAESDERITYWASPAGGKPVPFRLTEVESSRVLFTNYEHDFPQEIEYKRSGDKLHVKISDRSDKSASWTFQRADF